jgi:hypothetical protein
VSGVFLNLTKGPISAVVLTFFWIGLTMIVRVVVRAVTRTRKPVRVGFWGIPAGVWIGSLVLTASAYGRLQDSGAGAGAGDFSMLLLVGFAVAFAVRASRLRREQPD